MMKRAVFMILLALAAKAMAQQVRVTLQVIEVPHAVLTKWTTGEKLSGPEIHERAVKLTTAGSAEIVETSLLVVQSGQRALVESISERIYPSELEASDGLSAVAEPQRERDLSVFHSFRASDALPTFETRNNGTSLNIEPVVGGGGRLVDLRYEFEIVDRLALETWTEFRDQWGDASVRMPIFGTRRITGSVILHPGSFELCNVFTPKPADVPAVATRQLLFVRCDVLPLPK